MESHGIRPLELTFWELQGSKCRIKPGKKVWSLGQVAYGMIICHLAKNRGLPWWRLIMSSSILFPSNSKSVQRSLFILCLQAICKDSQKKQPPWKKVLVIEWSCSRGEQGVLFSFFGQPLRKCCCHIYCCKGMKLNTWLQKLAIPCKGKRTEGQEQ